MPIFKTLRVVLAEEMPLMNLRQRKLCLRTDPVEMFPTTKAIVVKTVRRVLLTLCLRVDLAEVLALLVQLPITLAMKSTIPYEKEVLQLIQRQALLFLDLELGP